MSLVIPKDTRISLVIPKDTPISLVIPNDPHISLVIPKDAHISLVIPKDTHISKVHYPIEEANCYPLVYTKPSTTVTLGQRSYYNFVIGFASQTDRLIEDGSGRVSWLARFESLEDEATTVDWFFGERRRWRFADDARRSDDRLLRRKTTSDDKSRKGPRRGSRLRGYRGSGRYGGRPKSKGAGERKLPHAADDVRLRLCRTTVGRGK
ncbi:hypothetical protein E5676_scaffold952G00170 [Cucumis melo var. makuwa]|uniref:NBS-LRR type resistance protein n=1 Tax=Cucumis melo var. makuwa TaxID=1194695 RepID=A0A5A7UE21_CUCMM|nr:hypothetical protein E6C27_scaffold60G001290 [Cucumis melo var. makuwa]TYK11556.1 hypothetical protein E5676_scaffold952G00170 [Cucumis melo var. makuwa]